MNNFKKVLKEIVFLEKEEVIRQRLLECVENVETWQYNIMKMLLMNKSAVNPIFRSLGLYGHVMLIGDRPSCFPPMKCRHAFTLCPGSEFLHKALSLCCPEPAHTFYLTNFIKCNDINKSERILHTEINLQRPKLIIALGDDAHKFLSNIKVPHIIEEHPSINQSKETLTFYSNRLKKAIEYFKPILKKNPQIKEVIK